MFKNILTATFLVVSFWAQTQCDTNRYKMPIFDSVTKYANVNYGQGQVWNIPYNNTDLYMDIYEPFGDPLAKRPLMIWVHPGGFLTGNKELEDMVALCDSFARRGYVTASIGYRLGFNPTSVASAERAVYRGTQDVRAAIRYLKEFALAYRLDTTSIFLGGSSAGAFATMHVAYLDQNEAPSSYTGTALSPDLGCLDCSGNTYNHTVELKGIVNLWGALGDSTFINSDETVPALLIHGTADGTVPFGVGHPFGVFTTPITHGSRCVSNQLTALGIPHTKYFIEGADHEPHGTSNGDWEGQAPTPYWDTIFDLIETHYWNLLKPASSVLSGDEFVCLNEVKTYTLPSSDMIRTCWEVSGGTILNQSVHSVTIRWTQPGIQSIQFTQFSELEAASSREVFAVNVSELPNPSFSYTQNQNTSSFSATENGASYTWDFAGLGTSTEQNPNFSFPLSGTYSVQLTVENAAGCKDSSIQDIQVSVLGISAIESSQVQVFPNPFSESITISSELNIDAVFIFDALGRLVFTASPSESIISLSNLDAGIYVLQVETEKGTIRKQIQKQ